MRSLPKLRSLVSKLRFGAHPHAHIRSGAAIATTVLVTSLVSPVALPTAAAAATEEPILANLDIHKTSDGTGHGTAGATFVNQDNGFSPGDNSPTDGVVSSGDVVLYQMSLNFTAGKKRTVKVSWSLDDAPYLSSDLNFCTDGTQVTAQKNDDGSCSFTVPAGVVESVVRTLYLRAKDTVGQFKPNQAPKLVIERVPSTQGNTGQRYETAVEKVGVVSAPAADLTIRDYGWDKDGAIDERRIRMPENGDPTEGYFDITVAAVGYPGYSTNGASTDGPWATNIDVTTFPASTTWTWVGSDGTPRTLVPVQTNGKLYLRLENQTGDGVLKYSIPFADLDGSSGASPAEPGKALNYNGYKEFNIQLVPDEDVFQTGDLKNLGTGGEPGRNQPRDATTENLATGAKAGYPYVNNDWSRAVIDRGPGPGAGRFGKQIQLPYTQNGTIFDESNVYFDKASGVRSVGLGTSDGKEQVAQGAESRNRAVLVLRNIKDKPTWWDDSSQAEYMADVWNPLEQQWNGTISMEVEYPSNGTKNTVSLTEGRDYRVAGYILRQDLYNDSTESECAAAVASDPAGACTSADDASPKSMGTESDSDNLRKALRWRAGDPRQLSESEWKNVAGVQVRLLRNPQFVASGDAANYPALFQQALASTDQSRLVFGGYDGSSDIWKWQAFLTIGTTIQKSYDQSSKVWDHAILETKAEVATSVLASFNSIPDAVVAKAPQKPTLELDSLTVVPKNPSTGKARDGGNAMPGDIASYTVDAHLNNIPLSGTIVHPALTVTLPATLLDPVSTSPFWTIQSIGEPNASGDREVVFVPKDPNYVPTLDITGKADFPALTFDATVSNLAISKIQVPTVAAAETGARGIVPAYSLITPARLVELNVVTDGGTSSALTTLIPYTEVNDQIGYHFNIYSGGTKFSASDQAITVIRFPDNVDSAMLGEDGTGLDGSWTDYPNGSSSFNGTYTLANPVSIRSENGTATTVLYSKMDSNSYAPEDFTWVTWEELGDDKSVTAIKIVSELEKKTVPGTSDTFPVAAADGEIYLQPEMGSNRKGDKYVMWLGNTRFYTDSGEKVMDPQTGEQLMGTVPWATRADITASDISGTVWSDDNRDFSIGNDEKKLANATVLLWKYNADGTKPDTPLRTMVTDEHGYYSFDQLHSGAYETEVKRIDDTVGADGNLVSSNDGDNGIFTHSTSYYNQTQSVDNTRSWKDTGEYAKDTSGLISLAITSSQPHVDYGFAVIDPKVTLDKTNVTQQCTPTECEVYWDVTVKNVGNDPIPMDGAVLTDSMSNANGQVLTSATVGMNGTGVTKVKFQLMGMGQTYGMALDQDGYLWAWGRLPAAEDGKDEDVTRVSYSSPVRYPVYDKTGKALRFRSLSVGAYHWMAIDTNGKLWGAGANRLKEVEDSAIQTVTTPEQILPDGNPATVWANAWAGWFGTYVTDTAGRRFVAGTNYEKQVDPASSDNTLFFKEVALDRFVNDDATPPTRVRVSDLSIYRNGFVLLDADTHQVWTQGGPGKTLGMFLGWANAPTGNDGHYYHVVDSSGVAIKAKALASAQHENFALSEDGKSLYLWGEWGALPGTRAATKSVSELTRGVATSFTAISAGDNNHVLALDENSNLWSIVGEAGNGSLAVEKLTLPAGVTPSQITVVQAGGDVQRYGVIDTNGYMYAWGANNTGSSQGTGDDIAHASPVSISPATQPVPDITGQKIEPITTTEDGTTKQTIRTYPILRDLQPNASIVYHFTTKVPRPQAGAQPVTVSNQARFSASNVPYRDVDSGTGVPLARANGVRSPSAPDRTKFNTITKDITGTTACYTGTDASGSNTPDIEKEHSFTLGLEDSCDQVGARIAAQISNTPNTSIKGVITGRYWFDENRDGIQNDNETRKFPNQLVTLLDESGKVVATTTTNADGKYKFTGLDIATYQVMFSRVRFAQFTRADAEENPRQPQNILSDTGGSSQKDSDASLNDDDYGVSTVVINLGDYPVTEDGALKRYEKDYIDVGVGPYKFNLMPHTGLGRWIFALSILVVLTGGAGLWLLRRRALAD